VSVALQQDLRYMYVCMGIPVHVCVYRTDKHVNTQIHTHVLDSNQLYGSFCVGHVIHFKSGPGMDSLRIHVVFIRNLANKDQNII
jgi:hypothetical protein